MQYRVGDNFRVAGLIDLRKIGNPVHIQDHVIGILGREGFQVALHVDHRRSE